MSIVVEFTMSVFASAGVIGGESEESRVMLLAAITIGLWLDPYDRTTQLSEVRVDDSASMIFFSYDGIQSAPIVFEELKNRSRKRMNKVLNRSFILLTGFYSLLGVLGYLSYAPNVPELIVFRQPLEGSPENDWVMVIARIVIAAALSAAVPINLLPTRRGIQHMIVGSRGFSSFANKVLTTGLLALA